MYSTPLRQPIPAITARCGMSLLVLAVAALPGQADDSAPRDSSRVATAQPAASQPIVIPDCRTSFPYRRRLASERSGILAETPEEGEQFAPGAVVARLSDAVPRAALEAARKKAGNDADVRQAKKAHELAKFSHDRMLAANKSRPGTFSEDEVRQRELDTAAAALRIDVAQHEFDVAQLEAKQAEAELSTYEIRTERGGIVTRVIKHDGEGVQLGEEVLEIVDPSVVRVEGYAHLAASRELAVGQPVTVSIPCHDTGASSVDTPRRCEGRVGFVDVTLTSGQEVRVWAEIPLPEGQILEGLGAELLIRP